MLRVFQGGGGDRPAFDPGSTFKVENENQVVAANVARESVHSGLDRAPVVGLFF